MKQSFQDIKNKSEQRQIKINNIKKELSNMIKIYNFHENNKIKYINKEYINKE